MGPHGEPVPGPVPPRQEFYEFIDGQFPVSTGYRIPEWDPPLKGDVLPNGMRGRFHCVIDRSGMIRLGIGRH